MAGQIGHALCASLGAICRHGALLLLLLPVSIVSS
jgi:hypothetical protein